MVTGQVPTDIWALLVSLFWIYSKIVENQLEEKYDNVTKILYDIVDPIDLIFNDVNDLHEIRKLARRPYAPL